MPQELRGDELVRMVLHKFHEFHPEQNIEKKKKA